jgi:acyl-CoA synthetase (AMP-forming)/AMP-acid ligase II
MNVSVLLDMVASSDSDRTAVGTLRSGTTYGDLARRAAVGGAFLRDQGCRSVAFIGLNGPAFPLAIFAASIAGVPIVPLNYRLADDELLALVDRLDDPLIVLDDTLAERLHLVDRRHVTVPEWWSVTDTGAAELTADSETDPAVVLFTSGTTTTPKGVVLNHAHLSSYVLETVEFLSADSAECALVSVPPYHVAGVASALSNAYAGRRVVYLPVFTAQAWLDIVRREGVTTAMVVPTMLARIVEHLSGQPAKTPTLQTLAYGGARMPVSVLEAALTAFPDTGFVNAYGLTETSSTISVLSPDDHRRAMTSHDAAERERLASAGRAVPGIEVQIRDDDGAVLDSRLEGKLYVRGAQVSGEYIGSGSSLDANGWFCTRDRAWTDSEGFLFIVGRGDDTIIRGGENIAPAEVEDVLRSHPEVADAAVVGLPDDQWGQRIAAVVTSTGSPDPVALREWVRDRVRSSKTPDLIEVWAELPYTATGKLLRRKVVEQLLEASSMSKNGYGPQPSSRARHEIG